MSSVNKNARHAPQACVRLCVQKYLDYMFTVGNICIGRCMIKSKRHRVSTQVQFSRLSLLLTFFPSVHSSALVVVKLSVELFLYFFNLSLTRHLSLREKFEQEQKQFIEYGFVLFLFMLSCSLHTVTPLLQTVKEVIACKR